MEQDSDSGFNNDIEANSFGGHLDPPIGVFWDIENCQVPKGKSAMAVVQCIRENYFEGHREAEFICVCDINKESKDVVRDLNNAQVTVIHVCATSKNAADDKISQCLRRFADVHSCPATVVLISGDIHFAADLSDLRYRRQFKVILLHNSTAPEALVVYAHECRHFHELLDSVPKKSEKSQVPKGPWGLLVSNLPVDRDTNHIRNRLKQLSDNCGGRIVFVKGKYGLLEFQTQEAFLRARKRMDKEDVFGNTISVNFPNTDIIPDEDSSLNRSKKGRATSSPRSRSADGSANRVHSYLPGDGAIAHKGYFPLPPLPPHPGTLFSKPATADFPSFYSLQSEANVLTEGSPPLPNALFGARFGESPPPFARFRHISENGILGAEDFSISWPSIGSNTSRGSPGRVQDAVGFRRQNDKTPEGARRIRGTHKGPVKEDESGNSSADYGNGNYTKTVFPVIQPPYGGTRWAWPKSPPLYLPHQQQMQGVWCGQLPEYGSSQQQHVPSSCASSRSSGGDRRAPHQYLTTTSPNFHQQHDQRNGNIVETPPAAEPVELLIYNLDQSINAKELKRVIMHVFREHVMVLHVSVILNGDNTLTAVVKVPSLQDAQYAISQLHRRRIGSKRILISVASTSYMPSLQVLRSEVYNMMCDIPGRQLPLFKFREMFEKRYHRSIGMSELHKLREVVSIVEEESSGRMVVLNPDYRDIPSPASSEGSKEIQEILEVTRCEIHSNWGDKSKGWAEFDEAPHLPNVNMSLRNLAPRIHSLLQTHVGGIPITNFCHCYKCEFGELEMDNTEDGVPLEHLVTCVPGVHIVKSAVGVKRIQWVEKKANEFAKLDLRSASPPLASQLALFSREITDLLKSQPQCRMQFNKFIPAYHHHFGRQCRVADYGFTKLLDLLEALPHIVQVIGEGNKRLLTLTHRMQVKRFLADLLRILKSLSKKTVSMSEFSTVYEHCLEKRFCVANYGVCDIADLLSDLPENSLVVSHDGEDVFISIPQREQTPVEQERTNQFAVDVVELLRHSPRCQMDFTKFIPAYHHHFGRQCRVAEYGFAKLIELFKAIPQTVDIKQNEDKEDKIIQLTPNEMLRIFADQIDFLLRSKKSPVPLGKLMDMFVQYQGYCVHPEDFGAANISELLSMIGNVKVVCIGSCTLVSLVEKGSLCQLSVQVRQILGEVPDSEMSFNEFSETFERLYHYVCDFAQITELKDVTVDENNGTLKLTQLSLFARDVAVMLNQHKGQIGVAQFEEAFFEHFGYCCHPQRYGHSSLSSLLQDIPEVVKVKGKGSKKFVQLQKSSQEIVTERAIRNCLAALKRYGDNPVSCNGNDTRSSGACHTDGTADSMYLKTLFLQPQPQPPPLVSPPSIFSSPPFAPSIPVTWMYQTISALPPSMRCSMPRTSPVTQWASSINGNGVCGAIGENGERNLHEDLAQKGAGSSSVSFSADVKGAFKPRLAANLSSEIVLEHFKTMPLFSKRCPPKFGKKQQGIKHVLNWI